MPINPIQRKARQSFLLGVIITLLVSLIVVVFLFIQMNKMKEQLNNVSEQKNKVFVLKQDVESGTELSIDMFKQEEVTKNAIPADATNIATVEGTPIAKIDLKANTVLTASMIEAKEYSTTDDLREQTYNMISLPIDLATGDYVDIRFMLPNGTDFIVLPKLKVTIPDYAGIPATNTIKVNVTEEEILTMSSAIVEAYKIEGSKLYAIKYAEAGNQEAAKITYEPRSDIKTLIDRNPNIVQKAMASLYNNLTKTYRENQINKYYDAGEDESVTAGIQGSTQATQEAREEYLSSLYGAY